MILSEEKRDFAEFREKRGLIMLTLGQKVVVTFHENEFYTAYGVYLSMRNIGFSFDEAFKIYQEEIRRDSYPEVLEALFSLFQKGDSSFLPLTLEIERKFTYSTEEIRCALRAWNEKKSLIPAIKEFRASFKTRGLLDSKLIIEWSRECSPFG